MLTSIKVFTGNTITAGQPIGITLNKVQGVLEKGVKYSLQFKVINYSSINTLDYIYVGTQKISNIDISQGTVIDTVDGKEVRLCSVEFTASSKVTNPIIKIGRDMVSSDTSNTLMYELTDFQLERGYKTNYSPNSNDLQIVKTDLESKINQLADSLQFYVAKNDFDNLGNTVSSALGQIEVSTGEISLKVEQTDIDNAKNELEGSIDKKISNAKAEIKMTTDSISQRVSSTESTTSTLSNKVTVVEGTANTAKSTADNANTLATTANNTANTNKNNIATLQSTVTTTNNKVAELTTNLDGITQRVQSTESSIQNTNNMLSQVSTGVNKVLFEMYSKTGQDGIEIVTIDDYLDATLLHTLLVDDFQMFNGSDQYLGKMTTHLYFNENVTHTVQAYADDGSSLYLNGTLVASMPTCENTLVTLNFKAGWNKIVWVYNEGNGEDGCRFTPSIKTLPGLVYMNAYPVSGDIEGLQAINSTVKTTKNKVAEIVTNLDSITQRVSSNETATANTQTQLNNLQIGGTNTFSLENFGVTDINYWQENQVICNKTNRGFDVETHQGKLHLRFYHVIKENGYWTVSFKYKSSVPIDPIHVDICDKGVGQLSSTTDWKTFEGTVCVDNYGQGDPFNFVDIEQHIDVGGYVKYEFKDVKVEKGNKATAWSPNPNDVQQQIDNTTNEISTTNNRVAEIVTNLDGITQRVSSTESTVSTHTTQLGTVDSRINTAKNDAISTASNDATTKANNALNDAKADATTKANQALNDAKAFTTTEVTKTNNKVAEIVTNLDSITSRVSATETLAETTKEEFSNAIDTSVGNRKWLFEKYTNTQLVGIGNGTYPTLEHLRNETLTSSEFVTTLPGYTSELGTYYIGVYTCYLYYDSDYAWSGSIITDDESTTYLNGVAVCQAPSCTSTQFTMNFKRGLNKLVIVHGEGGGGDGVTLSDLGAWKEYGAYATSVLNASMNHYSTTTQMNTAIEQKANQITQSVSQSYATKEEVNTIGVGGTNLLLHSSDYSDTSIWIRDGAWTTSSKYRGTCIYTTDRAWADIGYSVNNLYDRGVIEPNTKYTFSCYVRSNNEAYQPNIHFYGHDNHSELGAYVATASTTWKRISVTFQWYDFSIRDYPLRFEATTDTPQSGCYLEWAGFKLEKGTKVTDWTPAPEDSTESENKWLFEKYASDLAVNSSTSVYPTFDDIKPGCLLSSELIQYMTYQGDYGSTYLGKLTASFYFEADSTQTLTCATDDNSSWYLNGQLVDIAYSCQPKQITFYFKKGWNKLTVLYLEGHGGDGVTIEGLSGYTKMNAYNMGNIDEYGIYLNNKLISNYATKSEVTQTATDLTVKFTESGGYNLIHNGHAYRDSQGNIPYWSNNGGSEFNILGDARGGVRGNYFSLSMPNGMQYNDWIELKGNTHYVYQAQVWTGSPFTGNHNVPLHYWFSSNKSDIDKNGSVEFLDYNTTVSHAHTWTQIYIHFRTTEDVYMKPFVYGIDSSISPFYITEIMLSESRVVQRYASNSEEIYDGITKIDKNGITVTQSNAKTKTTMSADGFAITRTDKNADIFRVGSNGLLTLNGVFKCYKDNANMSGARLESSGAIMFGYNNSTSTKPVFASGLWTDENMGYFSVGYTRADVTDENGCLWMSPQQGNNGCRLTYSKLVGGNMASTNLYFQKDGALLFSSNINGLNSTDDRYTYQFDSGVSTRSLRCDNLRTYHIYPRNTGSSNIGSPSMRYRDIFADSMSTTNNQLRLGTVKSDGSWQTYGALDINSSTGYIFPHKGNGQLSLGTSGNRFHGIYLVNSPNVSSDERLKTDIHYLDEPMPEEPTIIDGRVERNMKITTKDMYDFVKDDLKLASYRYNLNLERGNTSTDYGFIAQDILYTKVGSELIQLEDKEDLNSTLSYNQGNYISTIVGALQEAINKIEVLEKKVQELESKLV